MRGFAAALLAAAIVSGCASPISPAANKATARAATPPATPTASSGAPAPPSSPTSPAPQPSPPAALVSCAAPGNSQPSLAVVGAGYQRVIVYDVADPTRPAPVCRLANTQVHLVSGTELEYLDFASGARSTVVRQTVGGSGRPVGSIPGSIETQSAWRVDGGYAYARRLPSTDGSCCGSEEEHVVFEGGDRIVCTNDIPIIGVGPARFFPERAFAFSADGRYFAAGSLFGRGGSLCSVIVDPSSGSVVARLPAGYSQGIWSSAGHRLFLTGPQGVQAWEGGGGFRQLTSEEWIRPNASPGGRYIAYTYYPHPRQSGDLRVGVFDLLADKPLPGLPGGPRSQAFFVTSTVLWYLEEGPCADRQCTWPTAPTGRVLAFDTRTGQEREVRFNPGDSPITMQDFMFFGRGDVWPAS